MKLLTAAQIRAWDKATIELEPIQSIDLMERAAAACAAFILKRFQVRSVLVLCGKGNNGGDGFAIARMLRDAGIRVEVFVVGAERDFSPDAAENAQRFGRSDLQFIKSEKDIPEFAKHDLIIDAIFGTGYTQRPSKIFETLVERLLPFTSKVISIDIPSGIEADYGFMEDPGSICAVSCNHLLSFQVPKQGFLLPETGNFYKHLHLLNIHLHPSFYESEETRDYFIAKEDVQHWYRSRKRVTHKGSFGRLLIIGGMEDYCGAAILAAGAALSAGAGYVYVATERDHFASLWQSYPELIALDIHEQVPEFEKYDAVVIGPGLGKSAYARKVLDALLTARVKVPVLFDADALNLIAIHHDIRTIDWPEKTVITPHIKEFERLFGAFSSHPLRLHYQHEYSKAKKIVTVLKSSNTTVSEKSGNLWYNITGNPGLAKAGSGDVLSGICGAFLANGYADETAAKMAVWFHGSCADFLLEHESEESMHPSQLSSMLGKVFKSIVQ